MIITAGYYAIFASPDGEEIPVGLIYSPDKVIENE
jgi:hypothetical protein